MNMNIIIDVCIFLLPLLLFGIFKLSLKIPLVIGNLMGLTFYFLTRPIGCPLLGCIDYPTQTELRDTLERFFYTLTNFWIDRFQQYFQNEKTQIKSQLSVDNLPKYYNMFSPDQWYYETKRALFVEFIAISLNYSILFLISMIIIKLLFLVRKIDT